MMPKSVEFRTALHGNAIVCDQRVAWIIKTPREFESFLVRHGFSRRQARSICSKGFRGAEPEAQPAETGDDRALELLRQLADHFGSPDGLKAK
jgi:hypothetical protein